MKPKSIAKIIVGALVLGLTGPLALADSVFLRSGPQAAELELKNVTFTRVKDGDIYYNVGTREAHRAIGETRLELTGETKFNEAENAFSAAVMAKDEAAAKKKYAAAAEAYEATAGSTNKPWLKEFIQLRMLIAGPKSGDISRAVKSWMMMVDKDPAEALKHKPSLDKVDPKSTYLTESAKLLSAAEKATSKPDARRAILDMLGDIQMAMGDNEGANKTLITRTTLGGTPEEVAALSVIIARNDVANKNYDAAMDRLKNVNLAALPDPVRADALYILAQCKGAKLQPASPGDEWKDLAIDYMKVVAGYPSSANAGEALLKVAEIHETLKDPDTALKVYRQVAREHAGTPAGQAAQKSIERLSKTAARN
jgi:tetratricopeptide (TPR) repeat protein